MDSPSAPTCRGRVPWQGLLLTVSLLAFWSPPTTAQLSVELVPPNASEGKDVLLRVYNLPGSLVGYAWYKGKSMDISHQIASYVIDTHEIHPAPLYSGQKTIYPNGSLLFQKVTLKDTGNYTLLATNKEFQHIQVTGQFRVYHDPTPQSPGLSDGAIAGIVIGVLAGVALIAALVYFLYIRKTGGSLKLHILCSPSVARNQRNQPQPLCPQQPQKRFIQK